MDTSKLNKNIPVPLYFQLKEILLNEIKEKHKVGDIFITEQEISRLFDISRPTVRQAINELVQEGYLVRHRGRGTFVEKPKVDQDFVNVIESFNHEMKRKNIIPKTEVVDSYIIKPFDNIADILNISENHDLFCLKRLRYGNDEPLLIVETFIPLDVFPEIQNVNFTKESLYDYFTSTGVEIESVERTFEAKLVSEENRIILNIPAGSAVHYFETIAHGSNSRIVEFSRCSYRGDRNKFTIKIKK